MQKSPIENTFWSQKLYHSKGETLSREHRISTLIKLKEVILKNERDINEALKKDLGKGDFEAYTSEVGFTLGSIEYTLKKLKKWMRPKRVKSPMVHFPVKSFIYPEPLGTVLVISPWNYPFQLLMTPVVGAIAAGNTVIMKPSEMASHTSEVVTRIIRESFDGQLLAVVEGGVEETNQLMDLPFDHVFFTGSTAVGKIIMQKAARNLTPVTLELGGKSPCMVYGDLDIDVTARRIAWGKFYNAGQTCVAPDYILVEKKLKEKLVEKIKKYIEQFYGKNQQESKDFGRIINERHFKRLSGMLESNKILIGGKTDAKDLFIEPTLVEATADSPAMQEEIFGPILPVIETENFEEALTFVRNRPKPLAAYLFTSEKDKQEAALAKISSGGMCLNDTLIHLATEHLPFGGVGESGIGRYHGHYSFDVFSHQKAVMKRPFFLDLSLRYPPYFGKLRLIKWLLHWLG